MELLQLRSLVQGFWDRIVLYNLSQFIIWLSNLLGGSYGLGIIVFTIITRLIMVPLMHFQYQSTRKQAILQPEIKALREKYSARDRATQEMLQAEMNALYEREGINQYAGCLPLLIQLPVMMALYQTISRTDVLKQGHFLWFQLDQPDPYFILPVLAALTTFITTWLSMKMQDTGGAGKVRMYVMPVMILFMSLGLSECVITLLVSRKRIYGRPTHLLLNNPFKFQKGKSGDCRREKRRAERSKKRKRHGK